MTIFIEDSFDSAHWLPNVPVGHKCKNMHGHTYRVRIEVSGEVGRKTGWVVDYDEIKTIWEPLKNQLDHQIINSVIENSTCENIAEWIGKRMVIQNAMAYCSQVEIRETEHCGAIWEP